jgi:glycosyltransferase involved in cell wall biosynthesis
MPNSSNTKPSISVLMSVYNNEQYVCEAIQSVLNQSYDDYELIVVNDGSTDKSKAIIDQYRQKNHRIHVIEHENRGLTPSLNIGLKACRGNFIARMDGDDICHSKRLEKQLQAFKENPKLVLVGSEVELIDEAGREVGPRGHQSAHDAIRRQLLQGNGGALTHPAVMFRRSAAVEVGGYDERFLNTQDLDFFLRLSEVGEVENLKEPLLKWRQHSKSINHTQAHLWKKMRMLALSKTIERIGAEQFFDQLLPGKSKLAQTGRDYFLKNSFKAGRYKAFVHYLSEHPRVSLWRRLIWRFRFVRRHGFFCVWYGRHKKGIWGDERTS